MSGDSPLTGLELQLQLLDGVAIGGVGGAQALAVESFAACFIVVGINLAVESRSVGGYAR